MNTPRYTGDELAVALNEIKILRGLYDGTKPLIEQYEADLAAYRAVIADIYRALELDPSGSIVIVAKILQLRAEADALRETVEACRVFVTPLERRKNWNEYKEDAAQRIRATLNSGV